MEMFFFQLIILWKEPCKNQVESRAFREIYTCIWYWTLQGQSLWYDNNFEKYDRQLYMENKDVFIQPAKFNTHNIYRTSIQVYNRTTQIGRRHDSNDAACYEENVCL